MKDRQKRTDQGTHEFSNSWLGLIAEFLMAFAFFAGFAVPFLILDLNMMFRILEAWGGGPLLTFLMGCIIIVFLGFIIGMFFAAIIGYTMEFFYKLLH